MVGTKRRSEGPPSRCPANKCARSKAEVKHLHSLKEEATCSICLEYFRDPVLVDCGHNFCTACINYCWQGLSTNFPCPQCRQVSAKRNLRPNRQLANVVEIARKLPVPTVKPQEENICVEHEERLKLFCVDDKKTICVICRESQEHRAHAVRPIEEAAQEYKDKLQTGLAALTLGVQTILGLKTKEENDTKELEVKFEDRKMVIMRAFENMHRFLEEEKCRFLTNLEEEWKKFLVIIQQNVTRLDEQHTSLRNLIREMEEKCQQQDVELLKDVQIFLNRCDSVKVQEPETDLLEREKKLQALYVELRTLILEFGGTSLVKPWIPSEGSH